MSEQKEISKRENVRDDVFSEGRNICQIFCVLDSDLQLSCLLPAVLRFFRAVCAAGAYVLSVFSHCLQRSSNYLSSCSVSIDCDAFSIIE